MGEEEIHKRNSSDDFSSNSLFKKHPEIARLHITPELRCQNSHYTLSTAHHDLREIHFRA